MKPLSKHIQYTLNNESLKEVFTQKLIDEKLDALNRISPQSKIDKSQTKSLIDSAINGN